MRPRSGGTRSLKFSKSVASRDTRDRQAPMLNVNEYFDGHVKSIGFQGNPLASSVGVMAPGEYEFSTSQHEVMTVIVGELFVSLPGSENFVSYPAGSSFEVDADRSFQLKVNNETAYLCTYE